MHKKIFECLNYNLMPIIVMSSTCSMSPFQSMMVCTSFLPSMGIGSAEGFQAHPLELLHVRGDLVLDAVAHKKQRVAFLEREVLALKVVFLYVVADGHTIAFEFDDFVLAHDEERLIGTGKTHF